MSRRPFLKKLGYLFLFLGLILAYLLFYLFPALVDINRSRRAVKNTLLKIQDLEREKIDILFPDEKERRIFEKSDRQYRMRFPLFQNHKDIKMFYHTLGTHVKKIAVESGITCLALFRDGEEPEMVIRLGGGQNRRLAGILEEELKKKHQKYAVDPSVSGDGKAVSHSGNRVYSSLFFLGFQARLKKGARMMVGLMDFPFQVEIREVLIQGGGEWPFFYMVLKGYGRMKPGFFSDGSDGVDGKWHPLGGPAHLSAQSYIDHNSPLLLKPVYHYFSFPEKKRQVPGFGRTALFVKKGGDG